MSSEIHMNTSSFGKLSEEADSLVIQVSGYSIDFCELSHEENKPLYTVHYDSGKAPSLPVNEHLLSAVKHFQFSKKTYRFVYVNYFTDRFTLCPAAFYDAEHARAMLEFNTGTIEENLVLNDDVTPDIKLIYAIDEKLKSALDLIFPHHRIKHSLSVLTQLMLHSEDLSKEQLLLYVHAEHIEIIVKEDTRLLLANQFSVKTQEDVLYYVLFILEQYQLNPVTVSMCVAGNINSNSDLMLTLKKYIRNIHLGIGHKSINWQGVEGMPQHFNYSLLNRSFCE